MPPELGPDFLGRLRSFVRRRLPPGSDADDVLQTVLLRLLQRSADDPPRSVHAWLFAVARSVVADLHRARRSTPPESLEAELPDAPPDAAARHEAAACLEPLLAELTPADQEILRAADLEGAPQAELARRLGVPASTVKSRVQRARARLRATLEQCCALELDHRGVPLTAVPRPGSRGCGPSDCG